MERICWGIDSAEDQGRLALDMRYEGLTHTYLNGIRILASSLYIVQVLNGLLAAPFRPENHL